MNAAAVSRDVLMPRPPDRTGRGAMLAFGVHVLLVVALAFSVRWRSSEPPALEAELWAAVPQAAAPRAVEPDTAPPPKPKVETPPPPKPAPPPEEQQRDAQIAIEKAKAEKERQRLEDEKRKEAERKKAEALQREKDEQERARKEAAEQKKREAAKVAAEKAQLEADRERQMQRIMGMAGATGAPNATGTAQRSAGPSASYAGRIKARIMPNIVFTDTVAGNPVASVEVRAGPDGTIIGRRLVKSSGVPAWDDAVLRAIDKTEVLPRDTDGTVPSPILIDFRPRD